MLMKSSQAERPSSRQCWRTKKSSFSIKGFGNVIEMRRGVLGRERRQRRLIRRRRRLLVGKQSVVVVDVLSNYWSRSNRTKWRRGVGCDARGHIGGAGWVDRGVGRVLWDP